MTPLKSEDNLMDKEAKYNYELQLKHLFGEYEQARADQKWYALFAFLFGIVVGFVWYWQMSGG